MMQTAEPAGGAAAPQTPPSETPGATPGATLLTGGEGGGTPPANPPATPATPATPPATPPGAPESYTDFTTPEGVTLDAEVLTSAKALAKELDLPQAQAQKMADLLASQHAATAKGQQEQTAAYVRQVAEGWIAEVQADKDIGGDKLPQSLAAAKEALVAFASPELRELLDKTGFGNNPHIIKHFVKLAPLAKQDGFFKPPAQTPADRLARMYPNTPTKS